MLNLNKHAKTKPKPTFIFQNCSRVCVSVCTQHRIALIISLLSSRQS